jgi:hypothetical protein
MPRCGVSTRVVAGGIREPTAQITPNVAPLSAARTAQRHPCRVRIPQVSVHRRDVGTCPAAFYSLFNCHRLAGKPKRVCLRNMEHATRFTSFDKRGFGVKFHAEAAQFF